MIIADAQRFNELLWNAALFTPKNGVTDGMIHLTAVDGRLKMFASDDFIVVSDEVSISQEDSGGEGVFLMALADLKALESWSRKAEGEIDLFIDRDSSTAIFYANAPEAADQVFEAPIHLGPGIHPWTALIQMVNSDSELESDQYGKYTRWALNPDRLKNIARMKIPGDHPIDFRQTFIPGWEDVAIWQFLLGPTVRGVITPMDREKLKENGNVIWG